jgi:hypothetical protein
MQALFLRDAIFFLWQHKRKSKAAFRTRIDSGVTWSFPTRSIVYGSLDSVLTATIRPWLIVIAVVKNQVGRRQSRQFGTIRNVSIYGIRHLSPAKWSKKRQDRLVIRYCLTLMSSGLSYWTFCSYFNFSSSSNF